jgi:Lycopene cyclase protein.
MGHQYDYIIVGAGLAGLSLAVRLCDPAFANVKVLILDKSPKNINDRTWSFWTRGKLPIDLDQIIHKSWPKMAFYGSEFTTVSEGRYHYSTIKGIDFYKYCLRIIDASTHVDFLQEEITDIEDRGDLVEVRSSSHTFTAPYVFDSIVKRYPIEDDLFVWQHFMGWEVSLQDGSWPSDTATLMDFRIEQGADTRFVYVLPFDERRALVEVTLFSKDVWSREQYSSLLSSYMTEYVGASYVIDREEMGKIPMTTAKFSNDSDRVIPIGTNNATVKPSTGYAFIRIQREMDSMIEQIRLGDIKKVEHKAKYLAYDRTLLNVLLTDKARGREVFSQMFKHNDMDQILKFLDEETSIFEEIKIFRTMPFWPFLRAFTYENVILPLLGARR